SSVGTSPRTCSTWSPQPFQVGLPHFLQVATLHIPPRVSLIGHTRTCTMTMTAFGVDTPQGYSVSCFHTPMGIQSISLTQRTALMTASPSTGLDSPPSAPHDEIQDVPAVGASGDARKAQAGLPSPFARLGAWAPPTSAGS